MIKKLEKLNINIIKFNRPEKANAFNGVVIKNIIQKLKEGEKNDSKFHLFLGNTEHFCSGADLSWILKEKSAYSELLKMYVKLSQCKKPIVSIVEGKCFGGGIGFLALSELVIANEKSFFCLPEANYNMTPGIFSEHLINKIGSNHFFNLSVTAKEFDGMTAQRLGLVNELFSNDSFYEESLTIIKLLLSRKDDYLKTLKKISNQKRPSINSLKELMRLNHKLIKK